MLSFSWALHYSCKLSHSLLCCGILWPRHCSVSSVQSKELFLFAVLNICVVFHLLTTHRGRQFSFYIIPPFPSLFFSIFSPLTMEDSPAFYIIPQFPSLLPHIRHSSWWGWHWRCHCWPTFSSTGMVQSWMSRRSLVLYKMLLLLWKQH